MTVLGIDTATSATAVALQHVDARSEARDDPATGAHPGHATRLLALADGLLAAAGVGWDELTMIAVGVGPGAFTGLRVGIATARGLAQSLGVPLTGVSSLRALAAPALAAGADGALAVIDARRGEVFAAAYETADGGPRELTEPTALAPDELVGLLAAAGVRRWSVVGDGALRHRDALAWAHDLMPPAHSPLHRVSASSICALALSGAAGAGLDVVPDYRRRPDAELALAEPAR